MKVPKKLSINELNKARVKALQNAKELMKDAELLLQGKRWPRVVFLCRTAEEEMGKYWFLVGAAIAAISGKIDWKHFWKTYRNHKGKTMMLHHLELWGLKGTHLVRELLELEKRADSLGKVRECALYSDVSTKDFVSPEEVIGQHLATRVFKLDMDRLELLELIEKESLKSGAVLSNLTKESVEKLLSRYQRGDS